MKRVAVITSSDKGYRGEREDLSGPAVKEIMEAAGYEVVSVDVLPDRKSTRLNSSHIQKSRMPSSA